MITTTELSAPVDHPGPKGAPLIPRNQHIIALRAQGLPYATIARQVGISPQSVYGIIAKHAPHLTGGGPARPATRYTAEILALRKQGLPHAVIARQLAISRRGVEKVVAKHAPELMGYGGVRLGPAAILAIVRMRHEGASYGAIGRAFHISPWRVHQAIAKHAPQVTGHRRISATPPDLPRILELRKAGATYVAIAQQSGIATRRVQRLIRRHAPHMMGKRRVPLTSQALDQILDLRRRGEAYDAIGRTFGITAGRVRRLIARHAPPLTRLHDVRLTPLSLPRILELRRQGYAYTTIARVCGMTAWRVKHTIRKHAPDLTGIGHARPAPRAFQPRKYRDAPRPTDDRQAYSRWYYQHVVKGGARILGARQHPRAPRPSLDPRGYRRWYYRNIVRAARERATIVVVAGSAPQPVLDRVLAAVSEAGYRVTLIKPPPSPGGRSRALTLVRRASLVVADVTDNCPEVLYTIGLAEGLRKRVIRTCRRDAIGLGAASDDVIAWEPETLDDFAMRLRRHTEARIGMGPARRRRRTRLEAPNLSAAIRESPPPSSPSLLSPPTTSPGTVHQANSGT